MLEFLIATQLPKPLACYRVCITNTPRVGTHRWRCQSLSGAKALARHFIDMGCGVGDDDVLDDCEPVWICFSERRSADPEVALRLDQFGADLIPHRAEQAPLLVF